MIKREKKKNQQVKHENAETPKTEQEVEKVDSEKLENDTNENTQLILIEENDYHQSYNWRLTKKSIGTFLVIVFSMVFFFLLFRIDQVTVFTKTKLQPTTK